MFLREISLAFVLISGLCATALAQTPPAPPPGSQVPVGNSVISYIEVAPGTEAKALAALKALRAASAKDAGAVSFLVLQRTTHPNHFALIETWKDNAAREGPSDEAACEDRARCAQGDRIRAL